MAAQQDGRRCHSLVNPFAEVSEMPKDKYTFRYLSENRLRGTITVRIRVNGYVGRVKAVLACVTEDNNDEGDPMPHPNMVTCPGKRQCKNGVCTIQTNITAEKNEIVFNQIGIQRITKKLLKEAMKMRTSDTDFPFVREYKRREDSIDVQTISTARVRLACQVLIQDATGAVINPLKAVATNLITHYPEKLKIIDASHNSGAPTGGLRLFLFTAKLPSSVVVVFREKVGKWRALGEAVKQHMKVALQFTTPAYQHRDLYGPVTVYYFMAVTVDSEDEQKKENLREFTYLPTITDEQVLNLIKEKPLHESIRNILSGVMRREDVAAAEKFLLTHHRHDGKAPVAVAATNQHGDGVVAGGSTAAVGVSHPHDDGGTAPPVAAAAIQFQQYVVDSELMDIHTPNCEQDGIILEHQLDDHALPPEWQSQEMNEVDITARHNLDEIVEWLIEQPMEED